MLSLFFAAGMAVCLTGWILAVRNRPRWVITVAQPDEDKQFVGWRWGCADEPGVSMESSTETALLFADRDSAERIARDFPDYWDTRIARVPARGGI